MGIIADTETAFAQLAGWQQGSIKVALVVILGYMLLKLLDLYLGKVLERLPRADRTVNRFVVRTVDLLGWVVILIVVLGVLGIDTAAMVGGLAIGGFVIGFAVKDTLGNLAAGVMLLFYRPFNVGDTVTIAGQSGDVQTLGMALTILKAADGRIITLPNGKVLGDAVTNHTREPIRRADVLVGIGYDDDIDTAVKAIMDALRSDDRVVAEPATSVRITDLGDNAVGLQVRPWVATADYWQAQADFHAVVKRALEAAGCSIPYPQRDVHMIAEAA